MFILALIKYIKHVYTLILLVLMAMSSLEMILSVVVAPLCNCTFVYKCRIMRTVIMTFEDNEVSCFASHCE